MKTPYLLLDYMPTGKSAPLPALLAWFASRRPAVFGLGVRPGQAFDPVPFVSTFPGDAHDVWVFAEWAAALNDILAEGRGPAQLQRWLEDNERSAVREHEFGAANSLAEVLSRLVAGRLEQRRPAMEALGFLLTQANPKWMVQREGTAEQGARTHAPDFTILDGDGGVIALVELKRALPPTLRTKTYQPSAQAWHVLVRHAPEEPVTCITALTAPNYLQALQAWLHSLGSSQDIA